MDKEDLDGFTPKLPELKPGGLYKVRQVALILNYSKQWVEEALLDGRIKATKFGQQYRITGEEIERVKKEGISAGKSKKKVKPQQPVAAQTVQPTPVKATNPPAVIPAPPAAAPPEAKAAPAPVKAPPPEAPKAPPEKPAETPKKKDFNIFGWMGN